MSEEPILFNAKETKTDSDCTIDGSKDTEDETSKEDDDPLKDSKNGNPVRKYEAASKAHLGASWKHKKQTYDKSGRVFKDLSRKTKKLADLKSKSLLPGSAETIESESHKLCDSIKIEVDDNNDIAEFSTGNVTKITSSLLLERKTDKSPNKKSQSLFPGSEEAIELHARKLWHDMKIEFKDKKDNAEFSTGDVTKIPPSLLSERKTDESPNKKNFPDSEEAIELQARKLWHDMKIEFNDKNDIAEFSTGNVTNTPSSLSPKSKTKKLADLNSKSLLSGSAETIESESHKLCDSIKIEVDDNNDIAEFSTGNVTKITSSLLSERKIDDSSNQNSQSLFPGSEKTIELQARKLFDGIKKGVDNVFDKSPKTPLPQKTKRITKPRPKKRCDICDKMFADSSSFAKHQRIHSDKKPFKCDRCHKSFRQSNDLKRHIRTHENNLEFSCDQCPSRFNCPFNLKRHKVVHAQEKPFKCNLCSSSFTRLNDMKTHTMLHVKKDLFKCQLCNMTFSRASNLKRHLSKHVFKEEPFS